YFTNRLRGPLSLAAAASIGAGSRSFRFRFLAITLHDMNPVKWGCIDETRNCGSKQMRSDSPCEILGFEVLAHAFMTALTAKAGLLHAPERRLRGRGQAVVDADDTIVERIGKPPGARG